MGQTRGSETPDMLPSYVHDIGTSTSLFCPYGAGVETGDRLYIYDEKTVFGRQQRERLVEVTAVRPFRSTGRVVMLDLVMISPEETARIAENSELTVDALLEHRPGNPTYNDKRLPVVVYFEPCDEDDTTGSHTRPGAALSLDSRPQNQHASAIERVFGKLFTWTKKPH
ncbi:MAG TPA: hypothetical protein VGM47_01930 [Gammaproteobacteria bacterium]|jgi:hypothetical protein